MHPEPGLCPLLSARTRGQGPSWSELQCNEASTVKEGSHLLGAFGSGCFPPGFVGELEESKAHLTLCGGKKKKKAKMEGARTSGLRCSSCHEEVANRPLGVPPPHGRHWDITDGSLPQCPPCRVRTSLVAPLSSGYGEPSAR